MLSYVLLIGCFLQLSKLQWMLIALMQSVDCNLCLDCCGCREREGEGESERVGNFTGL